MYLPDLTPMEDARLRLIAVGWLEPGYPYTAGNVDDALFARLMTFLVDPWQPFASAGFHPCGFCRFSAGPGSVHYRPSGGSDLRVTVGASNLFVPGQNVLYMAPSLIVHYIDAHGCRPPDEFIAAVLAYPEMRSFEYLRAIHVVGGAPHGTGRPIKLSMARFRKCSATVGSLETTGSDPTGA